MNNMDIRLPIGLLFTILGALLAGWGLVSDDAIYARSLGHNVNLSWGLVVLAFGAVFLFFGRRGTSGVRPAEADPEGREIERIEHLTGLEREGPPRGH